MEKSVTKYLRDESGRRIRVVLTRQDDEHGLICFAGQFAQLVKNPGTHAYDTGGQLYKSACDLYRKIFE